MIFELGNYIIDVDVEKTREYYVNPETAPRPCTCTGCRNFREYAKNCPDTLRDFTVSLGIDIEKPYEVYGINETGDGKLLYGGWWHLCGTVIKTDYRIGALDDGTSAILYDAYRVTEDFSVTFSDEMLAPMPRDFPTPRFTMEITATLPMLTDEVRDEYAPKTKSDRKKPLLKRKN